MPKWFLVPAESAVPLEDRDEAESYIHPAAEAAPAAEMEAPALTITPMDFLDQIDDHPDGIVVDETLARESPCIAYELSRANHPLVFSKGIIGGLDESQQALYCPTTEVIPLSAAQQERLSAFREGSEACHTAVADLPKGDRLQPFLACMREELKKRGQEL